jgi:integrase
LRPHLLRHPISYSDVILVCKVVAHGTLLIAAGVPVKVVSERLGHATPSYTIETYQHLLPGMQAQAALLFEQLVATGTPLSRLSSEKSEKTREKRREKMF